MKRIFLPTSLALLLSAGLSAAPSKITIDFDVDGNTRGFTAYSTSSATFSVAATGGLLTGTSPGGDPRLVYNSSTPIFSKPAAATWSDVTFRVRETAETSAVVTPWSNTSINVVINGSSGTSGATTIASTSATAEDSGDGFFTVTVPIPAAFTANDIRYFRLDPIGGTDAAGNLFEVDYVEVNLTNTPPMLVSTSPADDATGVGPNVTLTATFDEAIFLNTTGSITIKNLTTLTDTVISLPGPDPDGVLSVNGNVLTIDPTLDLGVGGDALAIEISADAIKDADEVFYAGILSTDSPNWNFTLDNLPPTPEYVHPIAGSGQAPLDGALFIAFDEAPVIGSGNLDLYRADHTLVEAIDVASLKVAVNGNRVSITPSSPLAFNTSYYVLIDNGAFTDNWGNSYGITDPATWSFTTIADDSTMLFGDSFNRPNDADLNASAGKYGTLGALTYTPVIIGTSNVQLTDGQLLLESNENDGNKGAIVYPNHNFADPAIAAAGGFSLTVDLNANLSGGTGRYLSIAVGRSSADIDAQTAATAVANSTTADLVVALRNNNTLWIYENGTNVTGTGLINAPATPTKMRIDYSLADFNLGSTVLYEVFFDDSTTAFASGSFTWSGTGENYISLSSNLILTFTPGERHALIDNFQVRTLGSRAGSGYESWADGAAFGEDKNGDGVTNGMAFLLGAVDPDAFAADRVPSATQNGGDLSLSFECLSGSARGDASLSVEFSSDLGLSDPWTAVAVPLEAGVSTMGAMQFNVSASGNLLNVEAKVSSGEGSNGRLFARIKGTRP